MHTLSPDKEGKRLGTLDPFFDANGKILLPIPLILMGSEVCPFLDFFFSEAKDDGAWSSRS